MVKTLLEREKNSSGSSYISDPIQARHSRKKQIKSEAKEKQKEGL